MKRRFFGTLLRRLRTDAEKSMGELARHLKVSVTYVSDVELGRRAPLTREKILSAAEFLGASPDRLLAAAAESKGVFELDANGLTPKKSQLGAALARGWNDLSSDAVDQIAKIVGRYESDE